MKQFVIVRSKGDDYGNCRKELAFVDDVRANQYYSFDRVEPQSDADVLKKYMTFVEEEEEQKRSDENCFYGNG